MTDVVATKTGPAVDPCAVLPGGHDKPEKSAKTGAEGTPDTPDSPPAGRTEGSTDPAGDPKVTLPGLPPANGGKEGGPVVDLPPVVSSLLPPASEPAPAGTPAEAKPPVALPAPLPDVVPPAVANAVAPAPVESKPAAPAAPAPVEAKPVPAVPLPAIAPADPAPAAKPAVPAPAAKPAVPAPAAKPAVPAPAVKPAGACAGCQAGGACAGREAGPGACGEAGAAGDLAGTEGRTEEAGHLPERHGDAGRRLHDPGDRGTPGLGGAWRHDVPEGGLSRDTSRGAGEPRPRHRSAGAWLSCVSVVLAR